MLNEQSYCKQWQLYTFIISDVKNYVPKLIHIVIMNEKMIINKT